MKPYYDHAGITIYHGDCREVLPQLAGPFDVIITDPVWPGAAAPLVGREAPNALFTTAATHFARLGRRVVVQLGCDTDPRFLSAIPACFPPLRVCWLEYAFPNCKGRLLNTGDVAYAFGPPPAPRPGRMVLPGRCVSGRVDFRTAGRKNWASKHTTRSARTLSHPAPRRREHVRWLVTWFSDGAVLDPFAGIGTTLLAAKEAGFPAAGIEIEERFCEAAARRLEQEVFAFEELPS